MKFSIILLASLLVFSVRLWGQLHFVKTVIVADTAEGGGARPEIVATPNGVFVLYLGDITTGENRTFKLKIYKSNLDTLVASKVLVSRTSEYGSPTDIRVASDGEYLYTFYETNKPTSPTTATTYLWGAKYTLNDSFNRIAYTSTPITSSKPLAQLADSGELVDDPAPLVGPSSVFVVTRIKSSISISGSTIYRVREFSKDSLSKLSEFDLDLSAAANGRARVNSFLYWDNNIYTVLASTVSDIGINESNNDGAKSDLVSVRMTEQWTFNPQVDVKPISAEPNDVEQYVSGLKADSNYFYVTYKQAAGSPPAGKQRAWIKIYNKDFSLVCQETVRTTIWGPSGGEIRPSIEILGTRIFSGQSNGTSLGNGTGEVSIYELNGTSVYDNTSTAPVRFSLFQNYPNPFNPTTTIHFSLPQRERVTLKIFDVLGREVATLANGELSAGEQSVQFNATNLSSGIYFYQMMAGSYVQRKKMIVLK
jgi:hypothetical protein